MNGFDLIRLQPDQVLKAGDVMTGNLTMTNNGKFIGDLQGNSDTTTRLKTTRNFTIGKTTRQFNGTGNASWSLDEIGAASVDHTHDTVGGIRIFVQQNQPVATKAGDIWISW